MKKELWLIFSIVFLGLLGFGIMIPTLPFIALKYDAHPVMIGLLVSSYSICQFIGSPILGRLSDKYGRKPILTLSLFGSAVGYMMIALSHSWFVLLLSRIVDGITGGNISVAQAYIADVTEGHERTKAMGLIAAAYGLGLVFGPTLGGVLSNFGWKWPFYGAAILSLVDCILIMKILPQSQIKKAYTSGKTHLPSLKNYIEIFKPISIFYINLVFFIISFVFSMLTGILTLYTQQTFGWKEINNGYFFTVIGVSTIVTQVVLLRFLVKKFTNQKLMLISTFILSVTFFVFVYVKTEIVFYLIAIIVSVLISILNTTAQTEISNEAKEENLGVIIGVVQGFSALARTLGPIVGGAVFGYLSFTSPFIVSGMILLLAWYIVLKFI